MPALFKPDRKVTLPAGAEVVDKDGTRFARLPDRRGRPALYPVTPDGRHYKRPAGKWHAWVPGPNGGRKRVALSANKDAAAAMLARLLADAEAGRCGLPSPGRAAASISTHLDDWRASLEANARTPAYVAAKVDRVRGVFDACGWVRPADLRADRLETFLAGLRADGPAAAALPAGREWFTPAEAARLLGGVTLSAVSKRVKRHGLAAGGNGKGRRLPRATVAALLADGGRGRAAGTSNDYLQAVRQFARWLVANGRLARDPFAALKPLNARLDCRRRRGELLPDERGRLLAAAEAAEPFRGLDGGDRVMLYRVALATGFRARELAALTPADFALAGPSPAARLAAGFTKNRHAAEQPLPPGVAADLAAYLAGRPAGHPVWPGKWAARSADMIRADLIAAGVPVEVPGPDGPEVRDFHALRCCYISDVIRAGADLKEAMTLARHSDPKLTAGRYARTRPAALAAVAARLPDPASGAPICAPAGGNDRANAGTAGEVSPVPADRQAPPAGAVEASGIVANGDGRGRLGMGEDEGEVRSRLRDSNSGPRLYESRSGRPPASAVAILASFIGPPVRHRPPASGPIGTELVQGPGR